MEDELKKLLDDRTDIATHIYERLDKNFKNTKDLTRIPTSAELVSMSQTIMNNLGKDFRTERIGEHKEAKKQLVKIPREDILTELENLQKNEEESYPIDVWEDGDVIVVDKTVDSMHDDLWNAVNTKVKTMGGHWVKPRYRWEIKP